MDAATDRRDVDALAAPLVGADDAQQLSQRYERRLCSRAVGFRTGLPDIGRTSQGNAVVLVELQEQHAQRARTLRLRLAMQIEAFDGRQRRRGCRPSFRRAGLAIGAIRHRNQHLPRVLEIAPPQQRDALAGKAIGIIGADAIVGDDHTLRRWCPALRAPARGARLVVLGPVNDRMRRHVGARCVRCGFRVSVQNFSSRRR